MVLMDYMYTCVSGLFEIEGIESPVELNSHPGRTTFLNQIFHNLNGGSPGNAVDELINYYENVIRGHIKKFTAGQRNSVTGIIQESAYCEESGMEAIWLAKSGPKGLLARTEGWENNPAGGMMRRGAAYMRMFDAYLKTGTTDAARQYEDLRTRCPDGWDLDADLHDINTANVLKKTTYESISACLSHETYIFCDTETFGKSMAR